MRKLTKSKVEKGHKKYYLLTDSLMESYCSKNTLITPKSKILIIAPHPDDEILGCGGLMLKYASQCDCLCLSSSGFKREMDTKSFKEISDERISEYHNVLDYVGIKRRWIFPVYGNIPHYEKIENLNAEYKKVLDFYKYDYIFLPGDGDSHREHQFATKQIIRNLIKDCDFNPSTKMVFYSVWGTIINPNYFEDISSVHKKKEIAFSLYRSRRTSEVDIFERISGLNLFYGLFIDSKYAEAYRVENIIEFVSREDDKNWAYFK